MPEELRIGFVGNPNCGKTTLFNAYTGANLKVANWPGVTVEKKEGAMKHHNTRYKLVDLPGIYSLTSYTMEEKVTRQYILSDDVDVIIDVTDASSLERNLYLTLQLMELGKPVVLALNMMDIVEERGMEIDIHRLPEMLGIPVIPVSARKKTGLDILIHAASHHKGIKGHDQLVHHHGEDSAHQHNHHTDFAMVYSDLLEDKIDVITDKMQEEYPMLNNYRWYAIKLLEADEEITELYPVSLPHIIDRSYETDIINQKYEFIEEIIEEVLVNKVSKEQLTDKVDDVLTNQWLGMPIFLAIMAAVFYFTFTIGDWLKGYFEILLGWFTTGTLDVFDKLQVNSILTSLIVDGIIAGVGGILTFLPNIFILFLALALIEDSGYMSRVAYVMDSLMGKIGLSGRAFIPMLLGFGCTVPAVMASRALEEKKDRFKTILLTPFMSCSAKLPIYILFSQMFFRDHAMAVAYSMYVLGIVVAILLSLILNIMEKDKVDNLLLIELPEYKTPNIRTIFIYVWEKVKGYLTKAGTTIFIASIIMWLLLNFGTSGYVTDMEQSFGSLFGKFLVPVFRPIGLGYWQIVVALIAGIAAKEVVVSSCAVLFGIGNINSTHGMNELVAILALGGFGAVSAYSLMVFSLLYVPCIATIATIRKETNSLKWTFQLVIFQMIIAWVVAFLAYRIGIFFTN